MKDSEAPQAKPAKRQKCDSTAVTKTIKRSSRFRGVSRHKWTGRYEAHLWDKLMWNVTQKKKGKQGTWLFSEAISSSYGLTLLSVFMTLVLFHGGSCNGIQTK